jgi:hypothetical protein
VTIERVYTVWDYYDGPRAGLADFLGQPHYFENKWDEAIGDWSPWYSLAPVDTETLNLALEQWAIWLAWNTKYRAGEVPVETHPGHGGIDARYDALESQLEERVGSPTSVSPIAMAKFDLIGDDEVVTWSVPPNTSLERTRGR